MGRCVDPCVLAMPGIQQLQAIIDGGAPKPGIHYLTGMEPTRVAPGEATFTMPASGWLRDSRGQIESSVLSVLADGPLGGAFQSTLPPHVPYTTLEISMNYLQPVPVGGDLSAQGRVICREGLSELRIEAGGALVGHGTSWCKVLPRIPTPPPEGAPAATPAPPAQGTDLSAEARKPPYLRAPPATVLPDHVWHQQTGLEILKEKIQGSLPPEPIAVLMGRRVVAAQHGQCSLALPATPWLYSPFPRVEGGVIAMLADAAMAGAVQSTLKAGRTFQPLDLKVNFLRPVTAGDLMRADATVTHATRSIALSDCTVTNAAGKPVAVAHATTRLKP